MNDKVTSWTVRKIAVVGPGIVGMPMAAMLAHARIMEGTNTPAGWSWCSATRRRRAGRWTPSTRAGRRSAASSPTLDRLVKESVAAGLLSASHDYEALADADMILISVQTDKKGDAPDYGPMFEALTGIALALQKRPTGQRAAHRVRVDAGTVVDGDRDHGSLRGARPGRGPGHPAGQQPQPGDAGPAGGAGGGVGQDHRRPAPGDAGADPADLFADRDQGEAARHQQHDGRGGEDAGERLPRRAHRVRRRGGALLRCT